MGQYITQSWGSGVVVSTLALINEVNLCRTWLVLRWVTMSGSIPGAGQLFQYVTNQPPKANSAFHPSWVGKWVPASAGKAKVGMVHSVNGWTRGVQVKLWDPLRTRAIPEHLRGVFTTRQNTNPRLPLPYLYTESPVYSRFSLVLTALTHQGTASLKWVSGYTASWFIHFRWLSIKIITTLDIQWYCRY